MQIAERACRPHEGVIAHLIDVRTAHHLDRGLWRARIAAVESVVVDSEIVVGVGERDIAVLRVVAAQIRVPALLLKIISKDIAGDDSGGVAAQSLEARDAVLLEDHAV